MAAETSPGTAPAADLSVDDCHLFVDSFTSLAMFMLNPDGTIVLWSRGAALVTGYAAEEMLGQHFSRLYVGEDVRTSKPNRQLEVARECGRVEDEGFRLCKDGSRLRANMVITTILDQDGALRGFGVVARDVTAKRLAEEELRESEQRFHGLVDAVVDYAIFMLDADGYVSTWNAGAARLKGYTAAEIIGEHFSVFYTPEDRDARKPQRFLEIVRREGRIEDEGWRIKKDGTRFWADVVITALRDEKGEVTGYAKVTRDLTERRQAQAELVREQVARAAAEQAEQRVRESEERYRALSNRLKVVFEGVADAIMAQDSERRIIFANTAAANVFGFDSAEALMKAPSDTVSSRFDFLDRDDRPSAGPTLRAADMLASGPSTEGVLHLRDRFTGIDRWVATRNSRVSGGGGEPDLVITIWHDVTSERRRERQARFIADATIALATSLDERTMLTALAEALVPGVGDWCSVSLVTDDTFENVAVVHRENRLSQALERFHRAFLDSTGELGPRPALRTGQTALLDFGASEAAQAALVAPVKLRGNTIGVIALFLDRGTRKYDWMHVASIEEICRRTSAALENARLYASAQRAVVRAEEASRAKDEFLATVSHELRTPLTAILGWARLLADRTKDPALAKPVNVIHRNAVAQAKIIDDILDVSRVITGKFRLETKTTELVSIVRDALEVVRPSAAGKGVALECTAETPAIELVADPQRLQQAIWNLLSNAVKFTDAGGKVSVSLRRTEFAALVAVEDTGAGIEPAFLPFVFDRFRQADATTTRRMGGLGLGLAIVRHIIELHGGKVSATSEGLGKGSTFIVVLPLRATAPEVGEVRPSSSKLVENPRRAVLSGIRVLVVEDDDDTRELLASALTERGAEVVSAASAFTAYQLFREQPPDVLISDVGMPGEDGYSFIARLRSLPADQGGDVPALALTAFAREEDQRRALAAGYTQHAGKPVDPDVLSTLVARLVAGD
jgi:PAS domain S-box-containing protein